MSFEWKLAAAGFVPIRSRPSFPGRQALREGWFRFLAVSRCGGSVTALIPGAAPDSCRRPAKRSLTWESHFLLTGPIKDLKPGSKNQKDIVCFQLACDVLPCAFSSRFRSIHGMEAVIL